MLSEHRHGLDYAPSFADEFLASLVAVSAAAHALDAMYGQLITPELRGAGPKDDAGREAHIRECLKRRFATGKRDATWITEFRWLFGLRDAAVHAEAVQSPSVPHPSGITHSGQMNADYSAESSVRAVDLLFDVLTTCRDHPKPADRDVRKWAADYSPAIEHMVTRLRVSRDTVPLVNGRDSAAG
jgi:hypothetical protein